MTVKADVSHGGADIHLDAIECELLMELAANAARVNRDAAEDQPIVYSDAPVTYLSVSLALGRRLLALEDRTV